MVPLTRRQSLLWVSGLMGVLSGCLDRVWPINFQGADLIFSYSHENPGDVETVPATDERIADVESIQRALTTGYERVSKQIALPETSPADLHGVELGGERLDERQEYNQVRYALNRLPYYGGDNGQSGWYVQYEGETIVLSILTFG